MLLSRPMDTKYCCKYILRLWKSCSNHVAIICTLNSYCCISGIMVGVLASVVVHRGFAPRSDQIKDYTTGIYCIPAKHASLGNNDKDWLVRNQVIVPGRRTISNRRLSMLV